MTTTSETVFHTSIPAQHPRSLLLLADGLRLARAATRLPADLLAVAIADQATELIAASVEARTGRQPTSLPWLSPPASLDDARNAVRRRTADLVSQLHARRPLPPVEELEALHHALLDLGLLLDARVLVSGQRYDETATSTPHSHVAAD